MICLSHHKWGRELEPEPMGTLAFGSRIFPLKSQSVMSQQEGGCLLSRTYEMVIFARQKLKNTQQFLMFQPIFKVMCTLWGDPLPPRKSLPALVPAALPLAVCSSASIFYKIQAPPRSKQKGKKGHSHSSVN